MQNEFNSHELNRLSSWISNNLGSTRWWLLATNLIVSTNCCTCGRRTNRIDGTSLFGIWLIESIWIESIKPIVGQFVGSSRSWTINSSTIRTWIIWKVFIFLPLWLRKIFTLFIIIFSFAQWRIIIERRKFRQWYSEHHFRNHSTTNTSTWIRTTKTLEKNIFCNLHSSNWAQKPSNQTILSLNYTKFPQIIALI